MNKQQKSATKRGIEWTDWTWNVITGCQHDCRWTMPDGSIAECYAKTVHEKFFGGKFEDVVYHSERTTEPLAIKEPGRIFLDSMSDLMGLGVEDYQINKVLDICAQADWHTFQLLTKNAPRLLKFEFPPNVWVGASVPPSFMYGKALDRMQQGAMLVKTLDVLAKVNAPVRWMSLEPVSWDCAGSFIGHPLQWVVIGAASNGNKIYQPKPEWIENLLRRFADSNTPVFFKGNLKGNPAAKVWREEFPTGKRPSTPPKQLSMFDSMTTPKVRYGD